MLKETVKTTIPVKLSDLGTAYDANGKKITNKQYVSGVVELSADFFKSADGSDAVTDAAKIVKIEVLDAALPPKDPQGWVLLESVTGNVLGKSQEPWDKVFEVPDDFADRVFTKGDAKYLLKISAKSTAEMYVDVVFDFVQPRIFTADEVRKLVSENMQGQGNELDLSNLLPNILLSLNNGGGSASISDLEGVEITDPKSGQTLVYDNGKWVNKDATGGASDLNLENGSGDYSLQQKGSANASGHVSFAENGGKSNGVYSHAEGGSTADGVMSHAEGNNSNAQGLYSHSEGDTTTAVGSASHTEGQESKTEASAVNAHAEGFRTTVRGANGHAEGNGCLVDTQATGGHAEGVSTVVKNIGGHAEGMNNISQNQVEHSEGKYNKSNTGESDSEKTIHSVGIGTSDDARKNAHEIMQNGDNYVIGVGGYDGTNPDDAKTLQEVLNGKVNVWQGSEDEFKEIQVKENDTMYLIEEEE